MTPAGIEPATFWFVAQHLKHSATAVAANGRDFSKFLNNKDKEIPDTR